LLLFLFQGGNGNFFWSKLIIIIIIIIVLNKTIIHNNKIILKKRKKGEKITELVAPMLSLQNSFKKYIWWVRAHIWNPLMY
jgi:hypothetical protein